MSSNENFFISSITEEILIKINNIYLNRDLSMIEMCNEIRNIFCGIKFYNGELHNEKLIYKIKELSKLESGRTCQIKEIDKHPFYNFANKLSEHIYNNHISELIEKFTQQTSEVILIEKKEPEKKNILGFLFSWRKKKNVGGFINNQDYENIPF